MLMSYVWAVALPMIAVVLMRLSRRKPGETLSPQRHPLRGFDLPFIIHFDSFPCE